MSQAQIKAVREFNPPNVYHLMENKKSSEGQPSPANQLRYPCRFCSIELVCYRDVHCLLSRLRSKRPSKCREITKHYIPVKEKKSRSSGTDNIPIGNLQESKRLEKEQEQNEQSSDIKLSNKQSKEENTLFDIEGNTKGKEEENVVALKEKVF